MGKSLEFELTENKDGFGDKAKVIFRLCDLDKSFKSIADKSPFPSEEFLNILKLGMTLAEKGYTDIKLVRFFEEEN